MMPEITTFMRHWSGLELSEDFAFSDWLLQGIVLVAVVVRFQS
jgi:hypothetical protein